MQIQRGLSAGPALWRLVLLIALLPGVEALAQADTIHFHNGTVGAAAVLELDEDHIRYHFIGEEAVRTAGRYAIDRIHMRSGRVERFSERVVLDPDTAPDAVVVIGDPLQAKGLRKVSEFTSHTAFVNFRTSSSGARRARQRILQQAAAQGCEFVLFTQDTEVLNQEVVVLRIRLWGVTQHRCKAIGYAY